MLRQTTKTLPGPKSIPGRAIFFHAFAGVVKVMGASGGLRGLVVVREGLASVRLPSDLAGTQGHSPLSLSQWLAKPSCDPYQGSGARKAEGKKREREGGKKLGEFLFHSVLYFFFGMLREGGRVGGQDSALPCWARLIH